MMQNLSRFTTRKIISLKLVFATATVLNNNPRELILKTIKKKYKFSEIQLEETVDSDLWEGWQ